MLTTTATGQVLLVAGVVTVLGDDGPIGVINVLDPDVIVVGGGLSKVQRLYQNVPQRWGTWVFSDSVETRLVPALHGDSSGVRGAAWLWPEAAP